MFLGGAQLGFLIFSSIQCDFEIQHSKYGDGSDPNPNGPNWKACKRTLYSQTGLGIRVVIYIAGKIISGIAPPRILDRHNFNVKKVIAMDMNLEEYVQVRRIRRYEANHFQS